MDAHETMTTNTSNPDTSYGTESDTDTDRSPESTDRTNEPWRYRCPECGSVTIRRRSKHAQDYSIPRSGDVTARWRCDYCSACFNDPLDAKHEAVPDVEVARETNPLPAPLNAATVREHCETTLMSTRGGTERRMHIDDDGAPLCDRRGRDPINDNSKLARRDVEAVPEGHYEWCKWCRRVAAAEWDLPATGCEEAGA